MTTCGWCVHRWINQQKLHNWGEALAAPRTGSWPLGHNLSSTRKKLLFLAAALTGVGLPRSSWLILTRHCSHKDSRCSWACLISKSWLLKTRVLWWVTWPRCSMADHPWADQPLLALSCPDQALHSNRASGGSLHNQTSLVFARLPLCSSKGCNFLTWLCVPQPGMLTGRDARDNLHLP